MTRDLVLWVFFKNNVPEKLIKLVRATYRHARIVFRTPYGRTEELRIDVGLHQGCVAVVLDTINREWRGSCLLMTVLVLMAESEKELQMKWKKLQQGLGRKA